MMKHQEAFGVLKESLSIAPGLGYPDFSKEFILKTDASLKGVGTILSHQGKDGKVCNCRCKLLFCPSEDQLSSWKSKSTWIVINSLHS